MDSLLMSMEYVRGYWWNTFGKLFVIWFISLALGIIPFIGTILSLVFYPFLLLFVLNMYHDLKKMKGEIEITAGTGERFFWWAVTWVGLVMEIIALLGGLLAILYGDNNWIEYIQQADQGMSL